MWLEEKKKKSGSDVGLIMLIPMNLYGNTSSTPSPHNLTSSRLQQKLATTTRERACTQTEGLFICKMKRDLFVQLLHEVIRPPKRNAKMSVKISFF